MFHDDGVVGVRDAQPVGDPEHVTVNRQARHSQRVAKHHVGRLAANAR